MKFQAIKLPADSKIRGVASDVKGDKILIYSNDEGDLFYKDVVCDRDKEVIYLGYQKFNRKDNFVFSKESALDIKDDIMDYLDECKKFAVEAPILALVGIKDARVLEGTITKEGDDLLVNVK